MKGSNKVAVAVAEKERVKKTEAAREEEKVAHE